MEYTEDLALNTLARNRVKVYPKDKAVYVNSHSIGIKLWGAIDFLKNHLKYRVVKEK